MIFYPVVIKNTPWCAYAKFTYQKLQTGQVRLSRNLVAANTSAVRVLSWNGMKTKRVGFSYVHWWIRPSSLRVRVFVHANESVKLYAKF